MTGLVYTIHGADTAADRLDVVRDLYAEVYTEPPHNETPDDVEAFAGTWPRRVAAPGFRLVLACDGAEPVGLAFGHQLTPDTRWWDGPDEPLPDDVTAERPGRTFAVIEMVTRAPWRRRGIARDLHAFLLAGRTEERVTLVVHPDNHAALSAYRSWGYHTLARVHPSDAFPDAYLMIRR